MNARTSLWLSLPVLALSMGAVASGDKQSASEVEVVQPITREVSDYEDLHGRTEPSATVRLRARVSGALEKVLLKDRAEVKKGDVLFEIDPRIYQAELKKAEAEVAAAQAVLARTEVDFKRAKGLFDRQVLGKDELDKAVASRAESLARLRAAEAVREIARLNLDFTRVTAPISGRFGSRPLDAGNVVKANETDLATLVSVKPMYVAFDIDERTTLRVRQATAKGFQAPVQLANEEDFPRRAEVDYVANRVDATPGTLRLRATLPNADGLLSPGLSVCVRMNTSKPHKALLVPERAVRQSLLSSSVLVVNAKDVVEDREVQLGQQHGDLIVVVKGLAASDRVMLEHDKGQTLGKVVRAKKVDFPGGR